MTAAESAIPATSWSNTPGHGRCPRTGAELTAALGTTDGPRHHERARDDAQTVTIAYRDDPAAFDGWFDAHRDGWIGDGAVADGVGRWVEVFRPAPNDAMAPTVPAGGQHPEYVHCDERTGLFGAL